MEFGGSGKLIGFCLFSCMIHLCIVTVFNSSQSQNLVVARPSLAGISMVTGSDFNFRPARELREDSTTADSSEPMTQGLPPLDSTVPPVLNIKNTDVTVPVTISQDYNVTPQKRIEVDVSSVFADQDDSVEPLSAIESEDNLPEAGAKLTQPETLLAVESPDFTSVDRLFGNDDVASHSEPQALLYEKNSAGLARGGAEGPSVGNPQALPLYDVNPKPVYPDVARSRGWQGRVLLEVTVGVDGSVDKVALMESSGYRVLDKAARKTVYRWKFIPAYVDGVTVPCKVQIPIDFHLNAARG